MKKLLILMLSLTCLLMVACSEKPTISLEDGYFQIVKKITAKEEISEKYINDLLKGYDITEGEEFKVAGGNVDGSDYVQRPFVYKDDNSSLSVTYSNYNNENQILPIYTFKDKGGDINLSFTPGLAEEGDIYSVMVSRDNLEQHEELCSDLYNNDGKWFEIYMDIIKSTEDEDMDIKTIKSLTKVEPKVEEYPATSSFNLDLTGYTFETEEESLTVQITKDNQIYGVLYNDLENGFTSSFYDKTLMNKDEKVHTGIIAYVKDLNKQKEVLNYITK